MPHSRESFSTRVTLQQIDAEIDPASINGEWMGFIKIAAEAIQPLLAATERLLSDPAQQNAKLPDLLNAMVESGQEVQALYTTGHWLDIDSLDDVVNAGNF
jgi:phosphoenolpyruvate phosphomutase